jgi:hypothetical protein
MGSTAKIFLAGSFVVWASALGISSTAGAPAFVQKTTNDGVYTKAQADGAKAQFDKMCAECHPFTVAAKKKPKDIPLGDEPFFETWSDRPLTDMATVITLTMPNDGSASVSEEEAMNLIAYVLQQNGIPAGSTPLSKDTASAILVRPKK